MNDPQTISSTLETVFTRIHREQMQDIPILNPAIRIQAVGFQLINGRVVGIIITPWLMNVVMLPRDDEDWSQFELGKKQAHKFPSKIYKFMVNDIDGIGVCQTHSLHSPMRAFASHEQALAAANKFLAELMVEREPNEDDLVDEELLGKIMRGEVEPETNFADFPADHNAAENNQSSTEKLSRRDLLRGKFQSTV